MEEQIPSHEVVALAAAARRQMPPRAAFRPEDDEVIAANADFLAPLGPVIVSSFYETVYGHAPTAQVFHEGERPARERSLEHWWERTIQGPRDDRYFGWLAMVGLLHVVRGVSNPMMIAMADHIGAVVAQRAHEAELPEAQERALEEAFRRFLATVSAVITYGYDKAVENALFEVAGMPSALLHRLRDQTVEKAVAEARSDLGIV